MTDDPYLTPTSDEAATLRLHITGWDELDPWPQSVCISILRGRHTVAQIVDDLGVTPEQFEHALRPLLGRGIVYSGATRSFLLK